MKPWLVVLALALALGSCQSRKNEVLVLGMIHAGHRDSALYGLDDVSEMIRALDPDYILCEIPPDRLPTAIQEFATTGLISEPRVRAFPEYVDVVFPMTRELDFQLIACAGWTKSMADDRRAKLAQWRETRAAESAEVEAARTRASERIAEHGSDNPVWIHTDAYDAIVKEGMEPYDRLFNDDLGPGGWTNINRAHYALIHRALDEHRGEGKRMLITFGAWHKYWFLEQLRLRDDIVLIHPIEAWREAVRP